MSHKRVISDQKGQAEIDRLNAFNQKKQSEQAVKKAFESNASKNQSSRNKDLGNKKSNLTADLPENEGSRNQNLGKGGNFNSSKESYISNVKKQNQ